nr:hypothetical protein [Ktedonobacteraceae bacterium]
ILHQITTNYWFFTVPLILGILYMALFSTHLFARHPPDGDLLELHPVATLSLRAMALDPRPAAYFARPLYRDLCIRLQDRLRRQGVTTIWLEGRAASGKTRMLYEILRGPSLAPHFARAIMLPTLPQTLSAAHLRQLTGQHLVLLFDDIDQDPRQISLIQQHLRTLRHHTGHITILLASRETTDTPLQPYFEALRGQGGEHVILTPMASDSAEWHDFLAWLPHQMPPESLDLDAFDGTPGSLILGLAQRTQELRQLPPDAQGVLFALAVLREADVHPTFTPRVQRLAGGIFTVPEAAFVEAIALLETTGWLRRTVIDSLEPTSPAIFLCMQEAGYPQPGKTILDDVVRASDLFAHHTVDAEALIDIAAMVRDRRELLPEQFLKALATPYLLEVAAEHLAEQGRATRAAAIEMQCGVAYVEQNQGASAIPHLEEALHAFPRDTHPLDWAAATNNLGNAYRISTEGERGANIELAITHLEESLDVYQRNAFPQEYADTNVKLARLYEDRTEGTLAANLDQGITCLHRAAQVQTRATAPRQWADIQSTLGVFYRRRIRGDKRANRERSLRACRGAAAVYEQLDEGTERRHELASIYNNLGDAYRQRLQGAQRANLDTALAYFHRALTYLEAQTPSWARTYNLIGMANDDFADADHIEEAIVAYETALSILNSEAHRRLWAWAANNMGRAYQHRLVGKLHDNRLTALDWYRCVAVAEVESVDARIWAMASLNRGLVCSEVAADLLGQSDAATWARYEQEAQDALDDVLEYARHHQDIDLIRQCEGALRCLHAREGAHAA